MRLTVARFRRIVSEELRRHQPAVVTIDQLTSIQEELDDLLASGKLSLSEYEREWLETLQSFGWTHDMYEREIDRRWEYVGSDKDVIVPRRSFGSN